MEILTAIPELPNWMNLVAPAAEHEMSSGRPADEVQRASEIMGRSNVSYDPVWKAVRDAKGDWVPVRCNNLRRALLLASSALQHRTQAHDVWRRGRLVCIRLKAEN